jgi:carbamoyl-phosphate synthase large subunit
MDAVELIRSGKVQLVVNTPRGRGPRADGAYIRQAARQYKVPLLTTVAAARAAAAGVVERGRHPFTVKSLQEHHQRSANGDAAGAAGGDGRAPGAGGGPEHGHSSA